jgi:hypothetical protein
MKNGLESFVTKIRESFFLPNKKTLHLTSITSKEKMIAHRAST